MKEGAHLDLVGAFNMKMREADDEALRRGQIYIDTEAAKTEGGDVAVSCNRPTLVRLLKTTGFDRIVTVAETVEEAAQALERSAASPQG